jgi:predicted nuclease of predicted toxin-antitoxin system
MSLLFDQNPSRKLVGLLATEYPGSEHIARAGDLGADDLTIWRHAAGQGLMVVSKDSDFRHLALLHGPPPKVIWLRVGNGPTTAVATLLRARVADVQAFVADNVYNPEVDSDSVDIGFSIRSVAGRVQSPRMEAQLKCTTVDEGDDGNLHFELKVKNYNELRGEHYVPRVLIVVIVPRLPQEWLTQDNESLALRRCGYWLSLRDMPETTNKATITLTIPRTQMFTVAALGQLLNAGGGA